MSPANPAKSCYDVRVPALRIIPLPARRKTNPARRARRYVISRTLPMGVSPSPGIETFAERFERKFLGGHGVIHKPLMEVEVPTIIQLPRKTQKGSVTDAQVKEAHEALIELGDREGLVVCDNMDSENAARGRARSLAELYATQYAYVTQGTTEVTTEKTEGAIVNPHRFLTAHAIPDPNNDGKWVGAVSIRGDQTDPATKPRKPKPKAAPAAPKPPAA